MPHSAHVAEQLFHTPALAGFPGFMRDHALPCLVLRLNPAAGGGYTVLIRHWLSEYGHLLRPDVHLSALAVTASMPTIPNYSIALSDVNIRPILDAILHHASSAAASVTTEVQGKAARCRQITLPIRIAEPLPPLQAPPIPSAAPFGVAGQVRNSMSTLAPRQRQPPGGQPERLAYATRPTRRL